MPPTTPFRHMLALPAHCRTALLPAHRPSTPLPRGTHHARFLSLPTIIRPSFWASMMPKPLKRHTPRTPSRAANPATPYIVLGLLVGSQAIQILWLKQARGHEMRRAEARIGLLREVIERVQSGEDVDVEGVLGTGVEESEREWREVLEGVGGEEVLWQSRRERRRGRGRGEEKERDVETKESGAEEEIAGKPVKVESVGGVRFY